MFCADLFERAENRDTCPVVPAGFTIGGEGYCRQLILLFLFYHGKPEDHPKVVSRNHQETDLSRERTPLLRIGFPKNPFSKISAQILVWPVFACFAYLFASANIFSLLKNLF